jgi:nucleotide-binding universal stress UspA family protein
MTRILIATDGSEPAELAVRVAAGLATPGSILRAVSVVAGPFGPVTGPLEGADPVARHEAALREARTITGARDLQLDLRRGDAATEIVHAAEEFGAHLVVTGSRSYGPLATVLLGSVSAAVVDRAPCPVLVARGPSVEPIVFATDGSDSALLAETVLHWWPRRSADPVTVVAIRQRHPPIIRVPGWPPGPAAAETVPADAADLAAGRLLVWGVPARAVCAEGDPSQRIVATTEALGAGLVVVGTQGRTGVRRALLGSVARSVLTHASCSVLVARATPGRYMDHERALAIEPGVVAGAG